MSRFDVAISTALAAIALGLGSGLLAEESTYKQVRRELETAGAVVELSDKAPSDAESTFRRVAFLPGADSAKAVKTLRSLARIHDLDETTLEFLSFDPTMIETLAGEAPLLGRLKAVQIAFRPDSDVTNDQFSQALRLPKLTLIAAIFVDKASPLDDNAFAAANEAKDLEVIVVRNSRITDFGLQLLSECSSLRELSLTGASIQGDGLKHLTKLPLEHLGLDDTQVSDDALSAVGGMDDLTSLTLSNCPIQGGGLSHIGKLDRLERLVLSGTGVEDADLKELQQLSKLQRLSLNQCNLTDEAIGHFTVMQGLKDLSVQGTRVSSNGAAKLTHARPDITIAR